MSQTTVSKADLQLIDHRIVNLGFECLGALTSGPISLRNLELKTKSKLVKLSREIHVYIDFSTVAHEAKSDLFKLEVSYYAHFKASEGVEFEKLEKFAKLNAPSIVFPTVRACISTVTLAANFPPLTLPIINFQNMPVEFEIVD